MYGTAINSVPYLALAVAALVVVLWLGRRRIRAAVGSGGHVVGLTTPQAYRPPASPVARVVALAVP